MQMMGICQPEKKEGRHTKEEGIYIMYMFQIVMELLVKHSAEFFNSGAHRLYHKLWTIVAL